MGQDVIQTENVSEAIRRALESRAVQKYLLVCGRSFAGLPVSLPKDIPFAVFNGFTANPRYEDACEGVELFRREGCGAVLAIGGGSAIDTAKCIKLFCRMDPAQNYLRQTYQDSGVPMIAVPTTAGTGSESTRFAVVYEAGVKQSVTHDSILPDCAILAPELLKTLPLYQKECAMLDALCQGIESWWSVNSTKESRKYSKTAVETIFRWREAYLRGESAEAAEQVMLAANDGGRAINITQTTAPHAMSYRLTSLYGLPHGHAVALCLPEVWEYMLEHPENCRDPRGEKYLSGILDEIACSTGCDTPQEAIHSFRKLLDTMGIHKPHTERRERDLDRLAGSVNSVRLKNNPVEIDTTALRYLYERILEV